MQECSNWNEQRYPNPCMALITEAPALRVEVYFVEECISCARDIRLVGANGNAKPPRKEDGVARQDGHGLPTCRLSFVPAQFVLRGSNTNERLCGDLAVISSVVTYIGTT